MQDFTGRRMIVFGVASDTSLAWAIARVLGDRGARVTLGYQKRFLSRVLQLVKDQTWIEQYVECDVSQDDSVKAFYSKVSGKFDGLVHAVAFAPAETFVNPITETTQEDFTVAMVVSSYSLVRVVKHGLAHLNPDAGVVTLTFLGASRVTPGYHVMGPAKAALEALVRELAAACGPTHGLRVNAISAGPVKTLAASGVPGFDSLLDLMAKSTPLRRNVSHEDVARATSFLLSPDAAGITGQTIYVDAGYSAMGGPPEPQPLLLERHQDPPGAIA